MAAFIGFRGYEHEKLHCPPALYWTVGCPGGVGRQYTTRANPAVLRLPATGATPGNRLHRRVGRGGSGGRHILAVGWPRKRRRSIPCINLSWLDRRPVGGRICLCAPDAGDRVAGV